ncbi:protein ELC-like [Salvia hispanica]|uniref:protein ELC-like n=1 Tax=Salvia hispanica TaxID=49212 RepID=UPI0020095341|nr:protein ELC-like [Salvia hispanica]
MAQQYTQQFLNTALSQRGPAALPYAEETKWRIRQHLMQLVESYPSLHPKTAVFTHNDGRAVTLLQADGTVPISFHGASYNIPVLIWLVESYPSRAPLVFVNPTRDMIIKRPHPFVSPNGVVSIPYLHSWLFPSSNLLELATNLAQFFASDPPLYSQRKPNPNPSPNLNSGMNPNPKPNLNSGYGSGRMEDPAEVFKKDAINKLVRDLNGDVRDMRKGSEGQMEGMLGVQAVLRRREEELRRGVKEMVDEKEALEQQLQVVLMNADVLEGWVRDNEGKLEGGNVESVDLDEAFVLCDALSKQRLDCAASDMAVEDTVYALDKAVQEGVMPFDQYLRNVRLLSREQFFHRATASKVRAVQMQAQVASMASRTSLQYAC